MSRPHDFFGRPVSHRVFPDPSDSLPSNEEIGDVFRFLPEKLTGLQRESERQSGELKKQSEEMEKQTRSGRVTQRIAVASLILVFLSLVLTIWLNWPQISSFLE